MVTVILTRTLADQYANGLAQFEAEASTVRALLRELDNRYAGLGTEIERAQGLAVNGEFIQDPLTEPLPDKAEVFILPKIAGG